MMNLIKWLMMWGLVIVWYITAIIEKLKEDLRK